MPTFNEKLQREVAFKGSKLSLENAKNHFEAGDILAEKGKYGLATSHVILSAEEIAKSFFLLGRYWMPDYEDYNYKKLFYDHKPKQFIASLASFFGLMLEKGNPFPFPIGDILFNELPDLNEEEIEHLVDTKQDRAQKAIGWLKAQLKPGSETEQVSNWWEEVNNRKNAGFYVNFEKEQWTTPNLFTKEDYKRAYNYVSGMIEFMDKMLEIQV